MCTCVCMHVRACVFMRVLELHHYYFLPIIRFLIFACKYHCDLSVYLLIEQLKI